MNNELRDKLAEEYATEDDIICLKQEKAFKVGWDARDQESANLRILLKDICEEWNEGCELSCDSVAHSENCAAVNIGVAKRKMKEEITALREKLKIAEEALELIKDGGVKTGIAANLSVRHLAQCDAAQEALALIRKEEK